MSEDNVVPFNPLDKRHLAESVAQAMFRRPLTAMADIDDFRGAGIYAIYYHGTFPAYKAIAERNNGANATAPIYVGKAIPKGGRKGSDLSASPGRALYLRLLQHRRSIDEAENLDLADFSCRYLVADDIWIPLGESLLIARLGPIWNILIDGFGNHDPGKGRHEGLRPRWDVLHPGRSWAEKCRPREESAGQIITEVRDYLRNNPPPEDSSLFIR